MKTTRLVFLLSLFAGLLSSSRVMAHEEPAKDPSIWHKSITSGLNYSSGNTETLFVNVNGKVFRDFESNIWEFELDGNYGETDEQEKPGVLDTGKETTKEDLTANAEYKRLITDLVYVGFGTKYRYDDIADIDYRVTLKPVLGYFWLKDDEFRFSTDIGPAYVFERVGNIDDDYLAPRVSDKFEWDISETAKFFQSAEYFFDVSDTQNYQITAEAGIEAALNSWLSLVLKVKDDYDNQPAATSDKNDFSVISALKVTL